MLVVEATAEIAELWIDRVSIPIGGHVPEFHSDVTSVIGTRHCLSVRFADSITREFELQSVRLEIHS